jgi:hypothetical protein
VQTGMVKRSDREFQGVVRDLWAIGGISSWSIM